ncbi:MAG: regulatory protein [Crocinitomicaceae bacterium]|jgi:regulatory protein
MQSERKYSLLEAKARLEALCAYQERCTFELRKKMGLWKMDFEDQDRLISDLISNNFLNEERYAEAYVSGRTRIKKWGRIKIRIELKRKFISDYSINKGLKSIDLDEYWNNLYGLAERKWNLLSAEKDLFKRKVKLYRFLSSKGYETDLIKDAVDQVINKQ